VTFNKLNIVRCVLNFKIDPDNRIWLLFCSSLRLEQDTEKQVIFFFEIFILQIAGKFVYGSQEFPLNYAPLDYLRNIGVPDTINTAIIKGKPTNMHKVIECVSCGALLGNSSFNKIDVFRTWGYH
jgi:hypothetical protein